MAAEQYVRHAVSDLRRAVNELQRQITDIQSRAANQERQLSSDIVEAERNATANHLEAELVSPDQAKDDIVMAVQLRKEADEKKQEKDRISREAAEHVSAKQALISELQAKANELESKSGDPNLR